MKTHDFRMYVLLLFVGLLILMAAPVWADVQKHEYVSKDHHNVNVDVGGTAVDVNVGGDAINIGGDTMTGGNVSTGGNKSIALGNVLGDVDIAGCLGSTQWSTPVYGKQKLVVNWVCVAEFYLRYQQPQLAAMALCNTEIVREFESEEQCEQAHQFLAMVAEPVMTESEDENEYHEEQMELLIDLQTKYAMLQDELEQAKKLPPPKAPVTKTIVEQKPFLSIEQRAALRELKQ